MSAHELVQIQQMTPGNVRVTVRNTPGIVCAPRCETVITIAQSYSGNGGQEVERKGLLTERRYLPSQTSGMFKCRLKVGKLRQLRVRCTWRLRSVTSQASVTRAASRRVNIVPDRIKPEGGAQASHETILGRRASAVSPDRCKFQQININTHVTHGFEGDTNIDSSCRTKAGLAVWDVQSESANTGQVQPAARTHSVTSGQSNIDRRTLLNPTRPDDAEESKRVFKHGFPEKRTLGKLSSQKLEDHFDLKIKERNPSSTSLKTGKLRPQYPKVVLCDIVKNGVQLSQDYSYSLPVVLKTKVIRCFKHKMRAIYRFEPSCLGHTAHQNPNEAAAAAAKNRECCPSVESERSICPSWKVTERQRHLRECTDAQTFPRHTTCSFPQEWTSEGSAACSASVSAGEQLHMGGCGAEMGEDFSPGFSLTGPDVLAEKRVKLDDTVKKSTLSSTPYFENAARRSAARSDCQGREETTDESQSCAEYALGNSASLVVAGNKNCFREEINSSEAPTLSETFSQNDNGDPDEPQSFTCQRVLAYVRKSVFSCARTDMPWPFSNRLQNPASLAVEPARPAERIDPPDNSLSPLDRNRPDAFRRSTNDSPLAAPKRLFSSQARHDPRQNGGKQDGESAEDVETQNWSSHDKASVCSLGSTTVELAAHLDLCVNSQAGPAAPDGTQFSTTTTSASLLPDSAPQTGISVSTPPPSLPSLSDWGSSTTTLSSRSSPDTVPASTAQQQKSTSVDSADASLPGCLVQIVEKPPFHSEEPQRTCAAPFSPLHSPDSSESCHSFLLLPQDTNQHCMEPAHSSPPKLEPYLHTSPIQPYLLNDKLVEYVLLTNRCLESEFILPPMLSPVSSPRPSSEGGPPTPRQGWAEDEERIQKATCSPIKSNRCDVSKIVNAGYGTSADNTEGLIPGLNRVPAGLTQAVPPGETQPFGHNSQDFGRNAEQKRQRESETTEEVPPDPEVLMTLLPGLLIERQYSSSSNDDDGSAEGSSLSASSSSGGEIEQTDAEGVTDLQQSVLDEFSAYEQDILLVAVTQDDPELFENLPQESLINLGPARTQKTRAQATASLPRSHGASSAPEQRLSTVNMNYLCGSPDNTEDSCSRPWRPHSCSTLAKMQNSSLSCAESLSKATVMTDDYNKQVNCEMLDRTANLNHSFRMSNNGPLSTIPANLAEFRPQKFKSYCRLYFSGSLSCGYKMCRYQHVPMEGDEKFCIDTVRRFTNIPGCLQKAGIVLTSYYHNNPPGVYFSMPVLLSLLWTQLKAGMVSDVFSVLRVSLAHRIVPSCGFLLSLFHDVREKGLVNFSSELMQLTSQMVSAGLVLNLDILDCIKNPSDVQPPVASNSATSMGFLAESSPDNLKLAHAIVEIALCTRQEDWRGMGDVFRSICQSNHRPNQMEHISGRIVIALLSESKNKLLLPYAIFAQAVIPNKDENSLAWGLFGRIGVSLMLRYHKTHQWAKGRKVVEVLVASKVSYSELKGLFGNEDGTSRCFLLTVAVELLLLSGSLEGALKTLRENNWFVSSSLWPCEMADLEMRIRVLMRLAERTSHRDALEVLCNLPGLKEPNELIDVSRFCPLFSTHLQTCLDRQVLPVASDTVDFMLTKKMTVDCGMLQMLLSKLGEQSHWLRAREVFRHSLSAGYYPGLSAPPGSMSLVVPCRLGEVELALAMEMSISLNASAILSTAEPADRSLTITLRRTQSVESEYLSAASRLLSASCILLPKLVVRYKAVNPSKEQVFAVCPSSALSWLRHNHRWAHEVWAN